MPERGPAAHSKLAIRQIALLRLLLSSLPGPFFAFLPRRHAGATYLHDPQISAPRSRVVVVPRRETTSSASVVTLSLPIARATRVSITRIVRSPVRHALQVKGNSSCAARREQQHPAADLRHRLASGSGEQHRTAGATRPVAAGAVHPRRPPVDDRAGLERDRHDPRPAGEPSDAGRLSNDLYMSAERVKKIGFSLHVGSDVPKNRLFLLRGRRC